MEAISATTTEAQKLKQAQVASTSPAACTKGLWQLLISFFM
jgi:hypothetical protein